jgi:uncharacterized protein (TIGR02145 family)
MKSLMAFVFLAMFLIVGCNDNSTNNPDPTVPDTVFTDIRDGEIYGIVKIDTQVWMSENLNASKYRNGDSIRHASTLADWLDAAQKQEGAWCYYDNDPINGVKYGKLYNWYAVNDSRGLAPAGYHVPSDREWTVLTDFLGGEIPAIQKMKSATGWADVVLKDKDSTIISGNGNNSSGFNGLPGGGCYVDGAFVLITEGGFWWSSSEIDAQEAWFRGLFNDNSKVARNRIKINGSSVRCLRD